MSTEYDSRPAEPEDQIICVKGEPGRFILFNRYHHDSEFIRSTVEIDLPLP